MNWLFDNSAGLQATVSFDPGRDPRNVAVRISGAGFAGLEDEASSILGLTLHTPETESVLLQTRRLVLRGEVVSWVDQMVDFLAFACDLTPNLSEEQAFHLPLVVSSREKGRERKLTALSLVMGRSRVTGSLFHLAIKCEEYLESWAWRMPGGPILDVETVAAEDLEAGVLTSNIFVLFDER